jgi:hypothetical protein
LPWQAYNHSEFGEALLTNFLPMNCPGFKSLPAILSCADCIDLNGCEPGDLHPSVQTVLFALTRFFSMMLGLIRRIMSAELKHGHPSQIFEDLEIQQSGQIGGHDNVFHQQVYEHRR